MLATVILAAFAVGAGVWSWFYLGWRSERPAITAIHNAGGRVTALSVAPAWLRTVLAGPNGKCEFVFYRATNAELHGDADCESLQPLGRLTRLRMWGVTDKAVKLAGTARNLDALYILQSSITDSSLASLQGLPKLYELWLLHVPIDDEAVPYLAKIPGLGNLRIIGTRVSKSGLLLLKQTLPTVEVSSDVK